MQAASLLGLNVMRREDEQYLWIAEKAARDVVLPPWVRLIDESTGVLILLHMCPHTTTCVIILLYKCPHTTINFS